MNHKNIVLGFSVLTIFLCFVLLIKDIIPVKSEIYNFKFVNKLDYSEFISVEQNPSVIINGEKGNIDLSSYQIESPFSKSYYDLKLNMFNVTNVVLYKPNIVNQTKSSSNIISFDIDNITFNVRIVSELSNSYVKLPQENIYSSEKYENKIAKLINDEYIVISFVNSNTKIQNKVHNDVINILNNISISSISNSTINRIKEINYYDYILKDEYLNNISSLSYNKLSFIYNDITFSLTGNIQIEPNDMRKYIKEADYWVYEDNTSTYINYVLLDKKNNVYHSLTINSQTHVDFDIISFKDFFYINTNITENKISLNINI